MNENKLIIVCSKNIAKNNAVRNIMKRYFKDFDIKSLDTNSNVSETPVGDDEGIKGCLNRIDDAINQDSKGDLYVAMEGILSKTEYGTFICGWTVVYNKNDDEYYYGCSSKVKVPDEILEKFNKSKRLSNIVADFIGSTDIEVGTIGTNGVLTNGSYTRTDEFMDSVLCAISSKFKKINE